MANAKTTAMKKPAAKKATMKPAAKKTKKPPAKPKTAARERKVGESYAGHSFGFQEAEPPPPSPPPLPPPRYTGHSFDFQEADAGVLNVTHAEVTENEIRVEWVEDAETGYLTATSDDCVTYRGNFGYPRPEPFYTAEIRLYRASNGDVLLFGRWRWASGESGLWLFRLTPTTN